MLEVYTRVAHWNSQRYERIFDKDLSISLLREEYQEWLRANTLVDELKELCDIAFVALGMTWKLKATDQEQDWASHNATTMVQGLLDLNELNPAFLIGTFVDVYEYGKDYPPLCTAHNIITAACTQMSGLGLSYDQIIEALLIVCDSNDSKSTEKVSANVKANATDKGPYFKPAEPSLAKLLEKTNVSIINA